MSGNLWTQVKLVEPHPQQWGQYPPPCRRPAAILSSIDLPEPLRPTRATRPPALTASSAPSSSGVPPKVRWMSAVWRRGGVAAMAGALYRRRGVESAASTAHCGGGPVLRRPGRCRGRGAPLPERDGGRDRDRTCDPSRVKGVRYRCATSPQERTYASGQPGLSSVEDGAEDGWRSRRLVYCSHDRGSRRRDREDQAAPRGSAGLRGRDLGADCTVRGEGIRAARGSPRGRARGPWRGRARRSMSVTGAARHPRWAILALDPYPTTRPSTG